MKSSKWMIGLVAVVLVLALAPSSFAQVQIQLFNTPSAGEIQTSRAANTADVQSVGAGLLVSGQLIAASSLTTTTLTLTFPGPITSSPNGLDGTIAGTIVTPIVPSTLEAIRIEGATGLFASLTAIASVNYAAGTITVTLPGFPGCTVAIVGCNPPGGNSVSGSFRVTGIRIDVNGKTGPLSISAASLGSSANNYIPPTSLPVLISTLSAGLASFSQGTLAGGNNLGKGLMFANSPAAPADTTASVVLSEGFASAWRNASQTATTGVGANIPNGSNILLTISALPAGITATLSRILIGNPATQPGIALTSGSLTSAATTTTLSFNATAGVSCNGVTAGACQNGGTAPDLNAVETVAFDVIFSLTGTLTLPLPAVSTTLAATITPNSTTTLTGGLPTVGTAYPRYATASISGVAILDVSQATTTMLVPFAARVGTQYDTGIAIANTTKDPFGTATGGATPAAGGLTFNLFPKLITGNVGSAGTQTTIVTSGTVRPGLNGGGLDAVGALPAGGSWSANLSELMAAASPAVTGDFIGYIFVQANFIDAHGVSYIVDTGKVTAAVPMLVLAPPAATTRNVVTVESLGF